MVIDRHFFRLKGKGAQDQGEIIYFGDIKELFIKEDSLLFSTFSREKYILSGFANLFESFLKDFVRIRNEYLADSLFMKVGMLYQEYEGQVEIINTFGKNLTKGKCRIQLYDGSIVIMPETRECFAIYLDFLKGHEFDEDEYVLRLFLENGTTVLVSKLGTSFEDAKETLESLLGKMYQRIFHFLVEYLPAFDAGTLLKLANKVKNGRSIPFSSLKKIHEEMPEKLLELGLQNNDALREKIFYLKNLSGEENFQLGFAFFRKPENKDVILKSWFLFALPEKNTLIMALTGSEKSYFYFFRIVMHEGLPNEKMMAKIFEINQAMILFKFDLSPVIKGIRDLKKTRFRTAARKLSFLRLLRKSYLGMCIDEDLKKFRERAEIFFQHAQKIESPGTGANAVTAIAVPALAQSGSKKL